MFTYPLNLIERAGPLVAWPENGAASDADPANRIHAITQDAVALANTDGGLIALPAEGLDHAAITALLAEVRQSARPPLTFGGDPQVAQTPRGPAWIVTVARGEAVHALADGAVLVRSGRSTRRLSGDEIRELVSAREVGEFEAEPVPGATRDDLDPALFADFVQRRAARMGTPLDLGDLLRDVGAFTPDGGISVAGMLLFGRDPQRWLPDSGARLEVFAGGSLARRLDFGGALIPLLDDVWDAIQEHARTPIEADAAPDYPHAALREALLNGALHRDFRLRGERLTVRLHPRYLEIISPGGLPAFMSHAQMLPGRYSRNPRLAAAVYQWGYAGQPGGGLMRMLGSMAHSGGRPPEIESAPYRVTVRLWNVHRAAQVPSKSPPAAPEPADDAAPDLNPRQRRALDHVRAHGSITLREYRALNGVNGSGARPDQLQHELTELEACGLLRRMGAAARAYYILA